MLRPQGYCEMLGNGLNKFQFLEAKKRLLIINITLFLFLSYIDNGGILREKKLHSYRFILSK